MASTPRLPTAAIDAGRWRRERGLIAGGVAAAVALSWLYLVQEASSMAGMGAAPMTRAWSGTDLTLVFAMWAVMMAAMMLPGALPTILLFARARTGRNAGGVVSSGFFAGGYVAAWSAFSIAATVAQWALHRASLLSPMMTASSAWVGAALLVAAGVYQFTPLKDRCLKHCQSPLGFLLSHWREGAGGAFAMGFSHGLFCVGCCWALMAILFALGVMNLAWIAALTGFVTLEKLVPLLRVPAGVLLVAWGVWIANAVVR